MASEVKVAWGDGAPSASEILLLASFFFTCQEVRYVWPAAARGVLDYILPGEFGVLDVLLCGDDRGSGEETSLPELVEGGDRHGPEAWEENRFGRN